MARRRNLPGEMPENFFNGEDPSDPEWFWKRVQQLNQASEASPGYRELGRSELDSGFNQLLNSASYIPEPIQRRLANIYVDAVEKTYRQLFPGDQGLSNIDNVMSGVQFSRQRTILNQMVTQSEVNTGLNSVSLAPSPGMNDMEVLGLQRGQDQLRGIRNIGDVLNTLASSVIPGIASNVAKGIERELNNMGSPINFEDQVASSLAGFIQNLYKWKPRTGTGKQRNFSPFGISQGFYEASEASRADAPLPGQISTSSPLAEYIAYEDQLSTTGSSVELLPGNRMRMNNLYSQSGRAFDPYGKVVPLRSTMGGQPAPQGWSPVILTQPEMERVAAMQGQENLGRSASVLLGQLTNAAKSKSTVQYVTPEMNIEQRREMVAADAPEFIQTNLGYLFPRYQDKPGRLQPNWITTADKGNPLFFTRNEFRTLLVQPLDENTPHLLRPAIEEARRIAKEMMISTGGPQLDPFEGVTIPTEAEDYAQVYGKGLPNTRPEEQVHHPGFSYNKVDPFTTRYAPGEEGDYVEVKENGITRRLRVVEGDREPGPGEIKLRSRSPFVEKITITQRDPVYTAADDIDEVLAIQPRDQADLNRGFRFTRAKSMLVTAEPVTSRDQNYARSLPPGPPGGKIEFGQTVTHNRIVEQYDEETGEFIEGVDIDEDKPITEIQRIAEYKEGLESTARILNNVGSMRPDQEQISSDLLSNRGTAGYLDRMPGGRSANDEQFRNAAWWARRAELVTRYGEDKANEIMEREAANKLKIAQAESARAEKKAQRRLVAARSAVSRIGSNAQELSVIETPVGEDEAYYASTGLDQGEPGHCDTAIPGSRITVLCQVRQPENPRRSRGIGQALRQIPWQCAGCHQGPDGGIPRIYPAAYRTECRECWEFRQVAGRNVAGEEEALRDELGHRHEGPGHFIPQRRRPGTHRRAAIHAG